ncbi:MAG TPA: heavy metal-binding domain-containing protein [Tepidisphaeraceae bacterium]|jgi:uncharacterized protein YbjQ (UPF0145 family)
MPVMTGLSGNEIYCLHLKSLAPGDLVIGNSVFSMGFLGGIGASFRGMLGGEVQQLTNVIHEGRMEAYKRMVSEASQVGAIGITGVTNELRQFHGQTEFLSVASCVHREDNQTGGRAEAIQFTTSANGQELYCQLDAGFAPIRFVFGNIAYSVGVAGGLLGGLKSLSRGEIKEFSDVFNATRHHCLERITAEARSVGANAVVGIETRTMTFQGAHEMLMLGTASHHSALGSGAAPPVQGHAGVLPYQPAGVPNIPPIAPGHIVSSDLTNEEMWNLVHMGYMPLKLVLGTAVYSLGVVGGIMAMFKGLARGEVPELTSLIYDAREHAIGLIRDEATAIGADDVVGIKTHITEHGPLLEFMAIGTAVKRVAGVTTQTPSLPAQAIIRDKDTWVGESATAAAVAAASAGRGRR